MARAARKPKDDETGEIPQKDFAQAVNLYRHDIKPALSKVGEHNQEAATAYKAIKKQCHIQPQAAKLAFKLDGMEEAKRDDFIRCLVGLLGVLNIPLASNDLVDQMEGKQQRAKPKLVTVPQPSDGTETDLADAAEDPAPSTSAAAIAAMRADHAKDKADEEFTEATEEELAQQDGRAGSDEDQDEG